MHRLAIVAGLLIGFLAGVSTVVLVFFVFIPAEPSGAAVAFIAILVPVLPVAGLIAGAVIAGRLVPRKNPKRSLV